MVLTRGLVPALVVPDEQSWTLLGADPARLGVQPALEAREVQRVLVPERVPQPLADALREWWPLLPRGVAIQALALDLPGDALVPSGPLAGAAAQAEPHGGQDHEMHGGHDGHEMHGGHEDHELHGGHEDHEMHGGHEGHDMMAIVGEPSGDMLVMEPLELRLGPLATTLPGGLAVDATLDGDVVAAATVQALLRREPHVGAAPAPPDPLSSAAWKLAFARAGEAGGGADAGAAARWVRIAAVELERAVSHLAWLRAFARLLSWSPAVARATRAIAASQGARASLPTDPTAAAAARAATQSALREVDAMADLARRSRPLRLRARGRGELSAAQARERGLTGPVARACGLAGDARAEDPLYRRLGFRSLTRPEGDALARARLRADEATQAVRLAAAALAAAEDAVAADPPPAAGDGATVEGPRGPLRARRVDGAWELTAPGADAARQSASAAMVGLPWSSALVALSSFDLSPWQVEGVR